MGPCRIALIAAAAAALPAAAQPSGSAAPVYEYWCHARLTGVAAPQDSVEIGKVFSDDETPPRLTVDWSDHQGSLVIRATTTGSAFASLKWPGDYYLLNQRAEFKTLEWDKGSFAVHFVGGEPADLHNRKAAKREEWRQTIISRDDALTIHERDGVRTLWLNGFNLYLMGDLEKPVGAAQLNMSVESLLAWGSGRDRLTVREVGVTRRKKRRNSYPTSPAGQRRIIRTYQIDVPELRHTVEAVRAATQKWEAGLGDYRSGCRRQERVNEDDIILISENAR
jgi:hypothetical protein